MAIRASEAERVLKALPDGPSPEGGARAAGYGQPPKHSRFRPGRSGNPRGRPKGARDKRRISVLEPGAERLQEIILEEAYRTIEVGDGGGRVSVTMAQAIVRALAVSAAQGDPRAQRLFTELLATTERENRRRHDALLETAIAYKSEWERELERRGRLGIRGPEPLPHPDDVVVDLETGEVRIAGPMGEGATEGIGGRGGREAGDGAEDNIPGLSKLLP